MKHKYTVLLLATLSILGTVSGQGPDWLWTRALSGVGNQYSYGITTDPFGNVYTVGYFLETLDFDPGPGVFELTSNGGMDIYISKLDPSGNFIWAGRIGGDGDDQGLSVAIDHTGGIIIAGLFLGTADLNPGIGTALATSNGGADICLVKLDSTGLYQWSTSFGSAGLERPNALAVDSLTNGDICLTGIFAGTTDFDPGPGTMELTSAGQSDAFVAKYDNSGNLIWAKGMGGPVIDYGWDVAPLFEGNGDVYVTGHYAGTADLDPGPGTDMHTALGVTDAFLLKLNSSGDFIWAKSYGGPGQDRALSLALEPGVAGAVYTTGYFNGTADLDPGVGVTEITSQGGSDAFVSKIDASGDLIWTRTFGGIDDEEGRSVIVDYGERVQVAGMFQETVDLDPGSDVFEVTSDGSFDIFLSSFDAGGTFEWAKTIHSAGVDVCNEMSVQPTGSIHITGYYFDETLYLGPNELPNAGQYDVFIAKLKPAIYTGIGDDHTTFVRSTIQPNPASGAATIIFGDHVGPVVISIFDLNGQLVASTNAGTAERKTVDISNLSDGIYMVEVQSEDRIERSKMVVSK